MAARYSEIEEYIMNKIHTGEWPIGYKIPKEVELCEQFGVSRSTVRTAMLRMVQDGHLKRVKRKGTFVTAPRVLEDTTVFIESFFNENRHELKLLHCSCWPINYSNLEELKKYLIENKYQYIKINSSYGMYGWIIAKDYTIKL